MDAGIIVVAAQQSRAVAVQARTLEIYSKML